MGAVTFSQRCLGIGETQNIITSMKPTWAALSLNSTVRLSILRTEATLLKRVFWNSLCLTRYSLVKITSSAVKGTPSCHLISGVSVTMKVVALSLTSTFRIRVDLTLPLASM